MFTQREMRNEKNLITFYLRAFAKTLHKTRKEEKIKNLMKNFPLISCNGGKYFLYLYNDDEVDKRRILN